MMLHHRALRRMFAFGMDFCGLSVCGLDVCELDLCGLEVCCLNVSSLRFYWRNLWLTNVRLVNLGLANVRHANIRLMDVRIVNFGLSSAGTVGRVRGRSDQCVSGSAANTGAATIKTTISASDRMGWHGVGERHNSWSLVVKARDAGLLPDVLSNQPTGRRMRSPDG